MKTYRLYELDVWGNENDGYDINDKYKTNMTITVNDEFSDHELIEELKKVFFAPSVDSFDNNIEVNDSC